MIESELDRGSSALALSAVIVAADTFRLAAARHFDLALVDTHAISYLAEHGPMSQTELARLLGLTSAGVTGLVDRLEQTGNARRALDPQDRRRHRIELTDHAWEILGECRESLARTFDRLDPASVEGVTCALTGLAAGLTEESRRFGS